MCNQDVFTEDFWFLFVSLSFTALPCCCYLSSKSRRVIVLIDKETREVGCSYTGLTRKCHPALFGMEGDTFGVGLLNLLDNHTKKKKRNILIYVLICTVKGLCYLYYGSLIRIMTSHVYHPSRATSLILESRKTFIVKVIAPFTRGKFPQNGWLS